MLRKCSTGQIFFKEKLQKAGKQCILSAEANTKIKVLYFMSKHSLAGKPCPPDLRTDIPKLIRSYFTTKVDPADPAQKVSFGTSGHRGVR